jgi:hypothetical protein
LLKRFEIRAAIASGARMPVADEDLEDVKLERAGHDLLARHQADERLERDAVNVDLAVRGCASRQDARELVCDVRQVVCFPAAAAQDQIMCADDAAHTIQLGLNVDRERGSLRDVHACEHRLGCVHGGAILLV